MFMKLPGAPVELAAAGQADEMRILGAMFRAKAVTALLCATACDAIAACTCAEAAVNCPLHGPRADQRSA